MANLGKKKRSSSTPKPASENLDARQPAGTSKPLSLKDSLKLRVQYARPWPASTDLPQILPDDMHVTGQEAAEYWAFCTGEQLTPSQISQAQCWQFSVHKDQFYRLEHIPAAEKQDRTRSLLAWHPIICKYATLGPDSGDSWAKNWARRCMQLEAYEIQFLQLLALGEAPQPVPEALLRELKAGLQQHLQQQQAVLQELRRQRAPLWVQAGNELKLLWPNEICFITSEAKVGLEVFTTAGERWPCFQTLAVVEQRFATEPDFMRTSRQHLVNLSHIDHVQPAGRGRNLTFRGQPADIKARVTDNFLKAFLDRLRG